MEYFKSNNDTSSDSSEDDIEKKEIKQKPKNKVFQSRANIYDQYMSKTDKNFVKVISYLEEFKIIQKKL